jgi:hypothetical protein
MLKWIFIVFKFDELSRNTSCTSSHFVSFGNEAITPAMRIFYTGSSLSLPLSLSLIFLYEVHTC